MFLAVPNFLAPPEVQSLRDLAAQGDFVDGSKTGGPAGESIKRNEQLKFTPEQVGTFLAHALEALRSDPEQARQCARLARYIARKLDDVEAHARCLRVHTQACMLLGRYPEALRSVDHALVLPRHLNLFSRQGHP